MWWTTKKEALADAVPYTVRQVRGLVPTASLANTWSWRNCLVGGAMPPKQSLHEHQIRNNAAIPPLGCLFSFFVSFAPSSHMTRTNNSSCLVLLKISHDKMTSDPTTASVGTTSGRRRKHRGRLSG